MTYHSPGARRSCSRNSATGSLSASSPAGSSAASSSNASSAAASASSTSCTAAASAGSPASSSSAASTSSASAASSSAATSASRTVSSASYRGDSDTVAASFLVVERIPQQYRLNGSRPLSFAPTARPGPKDSARVGVRYAVRDPRGPGGFLPD